MLAICKECLSHFVIFRSMVTHARCEDDSNGNRHTCDELIRPKYHIELNLTRKPNLLTCKTRY
jgi:hypothetical protein